MVKVLVLTFVLYLSCDANAAIPKKKKTTVLTHEQMVALKWRPTPTTAQSMKTGSFQGLGTVASIPSTLK